MFFYKGLKKFIKILEIIENNNLVNNDNLYDIFNQLKKQNVLKSEDSINEIKYLEKIGYIDSNLAIKLNQAVMENDGNLDDVLIMESLKTLANKSNNLNNTTKKPLYSVTLTSSQIKNIRKYNKNHKYDDFNLKCVGSKTGTACYSDFIRTYLNTNKSVCANTNDQSEKSFNSCADYSKRQ